MKPRTVTRVVEESAPPRLPPLAVLPDEAATMLSISRSLMYQLLSDKLIKSVKIHSKTVVPVECLQEYLRQNAA